MDNLFMAGKVTRLNILGVSFLQTSWQRYTPIEIESREFDLIKSFARQVTGHYGDFLFFFGGGVYLESISGVSSGVFRPLLTCL